MRIMDDFIRIDRCNGQQTTIADFLCLWLLAISSLSTRARVLVRVRHASQPSLSPPLPFLKGGDDLLQLCYFDVLFILTMPILLLS
jgi:hypothetical protein